MTNNPSNVVQLRKRGYIEVEDCDLELEEALREAYANNGPVVSLIAEFRERCIALSPPPDSGVVELVGAVEALGVMPEGYCFCSKDRIGNDSKVHEPECADLRAALAKVQP